MKNILAFMALFNLLNFAAQQLENGDFETWENVGTAEEEPVNWSSLKTADALANLSPQVVSRDAGRNGGFCPKLEVKSTFGISANGILTNGRVHADFNPENGYVFTDPNNANWHTSFNYRPDSIVGWFKYAPSGNDRGKVEIIIHDNDGRLPMGNTTTNVIGRARYDIVSSSATWQRFSAPFRYFDQRPSSFILVTIAAGDSTLSNAGTTLWVDDLALIYNDPTASTTIDSTTDFKVLIDYNTIKIESNEAIGTMEIYSLMGNLLHTSSVNTTLAHQLPQGVYLLVVRQGNQMEFKKVYLY